LNKGYLQNPRGALQIDKIGEKTLPLLKSFMSKKEIHATGKHGLLCPRRPMCHFQLIGLTLHKKETGTRSWILGYDGMHYGFCMFHISWMAFEIGHLVSIFAK
jgi:hypothetical protein